MCIRLIWHSLVFVCMHENHEKTKQNGSFFNVKLRVSILRKCLIFDQISSIKSRISKTRDFEKAFSQTSVIIQVCRVDEIQRQCPLMHQYEINKWLPTSGIKAACIGQISDGKIGYFEIINKIATKLTATHRRAVNRAYCLCVNTGYRSLVHLSRTQVVSRSLMPILHPELNTQYWGVGWGVSIVWCMFCIRFIRKLVRSESLTSSVEIMFDDKFCVWYLTAVHIVQVLLDDQLYLQSSWIWFRIYGAATNFDISFVKHNTATSMMSEW